MYWVIFSPTVPGGDDPENPQGWSLDAAAGASSLCQHTRRGNGHRWRFPKLWGYPVFHPWMTSLVLKAMVNLGSPPFQENLQMTFSKKLVSRKTDVFRRFPKSPGCDSHHFPIYPMKIGDGLPPKPQGQMCQGMETTIVGQMLWTP
jgi:hypothetical protein